MFSLKSLAEALQGADSDDEELQDKEEPEEGQEDEQELQEAGEGAGVVGNGGSGAEEHAGPKLSLWGVATALTATVKARTAQVLTAVQEVDWREELEAFQQGAKEDAEAVGKSADSVMHSALEAVEQLPTTLEHLPGGAAALQARAQAVGSAARAKAERSLTGLAGLGTKLVLSTHDLMEQISQAVQNEMSMIDDSTARHTSSTKALAGGGRYSRFDADVAAMQRDSSTYCDEPENSEEFEAWLAGFDLAARKPDIDRLIAQNTFMSELQARIVPLIVDYDAFWTRYFYRLHNLEQKHQQFLQLARRVQQQEEEVAWDDEDDNHAAAQQSAMPADQQPVQNVDVAPAADVLVPREAELAGAAAQGGACPVLTSDSLACSGSQAQNEQGSSDGSAAAASSDSDHWQVLQRLHQEQQQPATNEQRETAQAAEAYNVLGARAGTGIIAAPAQVAPEPAEEDASEMSDWSEATGEASKAEDVDGWGSDWE